MTANNDQANDAHGFPRPFAHEGKHDEAETNSGDNLKNKAVEAGIEIEAKIDKGKFQQDQVQATLYQKSPALLLIVASL